MRSIRLGICSLLLMFFLASISQAQGGVQRTFVSGLGNDANPCSRTAPCRTFGQAMQFTTFGGEVIVLDSAGYGPVNIISSVSIIAPPGVYAGTSVFSGDGIEINAGAADVVILRGLTFNNQGSSGNGITFNSGGTLHVESCVVNGFSSGAGISFVAPGRLEVKDSIIRGSGIGISVQPAASMAFAAIDNVRLEWNVSQGLYAASGAVVTVSNSLASGNGVAGFEAASTSSADADLSLKNCSAHRNSVAGVLAESDNTGVARIAVHDTMATGNGRGFMAKSTSSADAELMVDSCVASYNFHDGVFAWSVSTGVARVRVSNSTAAYNGVAGLSNNGAPAVLLSRGNNTVEGNASQDTFGTIGSITAK